MRVRQINIFVETNLKLYLDFGFSEGSSLGIIKWDLCDKLNESGLSSNLLLHLFQKIIELTK